ncbi:olfactory receptor 52K2-like [Pygocentrus nattereri]|uniref:olfactory receptor 52K2-like n=1 Tax=Pygocentrus nattereri TaxID=42514 RepID=UPI000814AA90|nr:olfactory receptor 52K2-like [Pygocentrus nattereri]
MQANHSSISLLLRMESLDIPQTGILPTFIMGVVAYCFILTCNLTVLLTIALDNKLHKPMYILLFNLPVNDLIGATALFPQLIASIHLQNRNISFPACVFQALMVHLYCGGTLIILTVMAYDRYVAICQPLHYHTVMTPRNLRRMTVGIWLTDVVLIGVLFLMLTPFSFCQNLIADMYCNNPSIMKLTCEITTVNNAYGLFLSVFLQGVSTIVVIFTYIQILKTCLLNKQADTKSKAIRTCATHLVVFIVFQVTTIFSVLSHRFSQVSPYLRRSVGMSILVFPPILNPLIYGLNTKEIREKTMFLFIRNKITFTK